jgi:fatty-acyl-CoA synthase
MFLLELEHPSFPTRQLSSLRTGIIAGAPCPISLMRKLIEQMHLREITIAYGMTETGPASFQTARNDTLERRVGTVGRILPHTEAKIVDAKGNTSPVGEPGEFLCRGYGTMLGYWGDPEKTGEAIDHDGWMRSGDLAQFDANGYCRIVGRIKDMLIRGGENIFPTEIESCLYTHPCVEQAEVFGVPDPKYGETVCAWVRVKDGTVVSADDLRSFLKAHIAHFKIPEHIEFVEAFPTTASGKVQKYKMRAAMTSRLGLNASEDPS